MSCGPESYFCLYTHLHKWSLLDFFWKVYTAAICGTWSAEVIYSPHLHGWLWSVGSLDWGFCLLEHGVKWLDVWVTHLWLRSLGTGEENRKNSQGVFGGWKHIVSLCTVVLTVLEGIPSSVWGPLPEGSFPTSWTSPGTSSCMTFSQPDSHRSQQLERQRKKYVAYFKYQYFILKYPRKEYMTTFRSWLFAFSCTN